ncbi:MAG: metalloregulator ArsR/SmtB family transcription factor [Actinobacteria bacterium]|nr:metalloregulator ArsR/SmtB family transcription factor [Actinomycetota bacterium]
MKKILKILKALSEEHRLRIVNLLIHEKSLCVCEITKIIGLSQPTISLNLKKLEEAEIVEHSKKGLWVYYDFNSNIDKEIELVIMSILNKIKNDKIIKNDILKLIK